MCPGRDFYSDTDTANCVSVAQDYKQPLTNEDLGVLNQMMLVLAAWVPIVNVESTSFVIIGILIKHWNIPIPGFVL